MESNFRVADFLQVSALAYKLWDICKKSEEFKPITGDVKSLIIVLDAIEKFWKDLLYNGQDLDSEQKRDLEHLSHGCRDVLRDLEKLQQERENAQAVNSLGLGYQDRGHALVKGIGNIRNRMMRRTQILAAYNATISASSNSYAQAKILETLNKIQLEYHSGHRSAPAFSQATSESLEYASTWQTIVSDIVDQGNDVSAVNSHQSFIKSWIDNVIVEEDEEADEKLNTFETLSETGTIGWSGNQTTQSVAGTIRRKPVAPQVRSPKPEPPTSPISEAPSFSLASGMSSLRLGAPTIQSGSSDSETIIASSGYRDDRTDIASTAGTEITSYGGTTLPKQVDPPNDPKVHQMIRDIVALQVYGPTEEIVGQLYDYLAGINTIWISRQGFGEIIGCLVTAANQEFSIPAFERAYAAIRPAPTPLVTREDFIKLFSVNISIGGWTNPRFSAFEAPEEGLRNFVGTTTLGVQQRVQAAFLEHYRYNELLSPLPWGWQEERSSQGYWVFGHGLASHVNTSLTGGERPYVEPRSFTAISILAANLCVPAVRKARQIYEKLPEFEKKLYNSCNPCLTKIEEAIFHLTMLSEQPKWNQPTAASPLDEARVLLKLLPDAEAANVPTRERKNSLTKPITEEEWGLYGGLEEILGYTWTSLIMIVGFMIRAGLLHDNLSLPETLSSYRWNAMWPQLWLEKEIFSITYDQSLLTQAQDWLRTHIDRRNDALENIRRAIRLRKRHIIMNRQQYQFAWAGITVSDLIASTSTAKTRVLSWTAMDPRGLGQRALDKGNWSKSRTVQEVTRNKSTYDVLYAEESYLIVHVEARTGIMDGKTVWIYQQRFDKLFDQQLPSRELIALSHPWTGTFQLPFQKKLTGDNPELNKLDPPAIFIRLVSTTAPTLENPVRNIDDLISVKDLSTPEDRRPYLRRDLETAVLNSKTSIQLQLLHAGEVFYYQHRQWKINGIGPTEINSRESRIWKLLPLLEAFHRMNDSEKEAVLASFGVKMEHSIYRYVPNTANNAQRTNTQ